MVKVTQFLCSLQGLPWKVGRTAHLVSLDHLTLQSCSLSRTPSEIPTPIVVLEKEAQYRPKIGMDSFKLRANEATNALTDNTESVGQVPQPEPTSTGEEIKEKTYTGFETTGDAEFLIFAGEKCSQDTESIQGFISGKELKLPDGAVLMWATQMPESVAEDGYFKGDLYLKSLHTIQFGRSLLWSPCLPSTHTLLSQNFRAFPLGTVCVADAQLHGKGRTGNVWESPLGCLMFSFTLQMENGRTLPFLQYVVSLAIIEAIESVSSQKGLPAPPVKIKWPNDLYANGMKIGGVLCTSTYSDKKFNVVVGIGLNVGNRRPTTCLDALLQDLVAGAPPFTREELLVSFFEKFEELLKVFLNEGFPALEASYYEKWLHSGQKVVLEERHEDSSISEVSLIIQGLSPTGYLLATDDQMETYELHPDGNSFDFLKGLVRAKLKS